MLGISLDVTPRKEAELQARQQRAELSHLNRVAMMAEMAASFAHELNQPLTGILSNASAGARFIDRGEINLAELRELLADIAADGRRAGDVIRGIRSMVKKGQTAAQRMDVNELVTNVVRLVTPDASLRKCEVKASLQPGLAAIEGDPIQFEQVLLNLIVNGFEAMHDTPVSSRKIMIATGSNGNGAIQISVRDFGVGIAEDARERLFEQFFTTKADGLGMGLAIARTIVESNAGTIGAEDAEGGGARFYFTFPAIAPASK
jgi:C4-dicarboxylate-specific signal transduction histidine kinase